MPAMQTDEFTRYEVVQEHQGESCHIHAYPEGATQDQPGPGHWHWYPTYGEETFSKSQARKFFGVTCGMSEDTRNHVVDQIVFEAPATNE